MDEHVDEASVPIAHALTHPPRLGAVLLAAGAASRMGGRPKCLLELAGVPLIQRQLRALLGAGVEEVVVVLGHYANQVRAALAPFQVRPVTNPTPDDGQESSVRLGLRASSPQLDGVVVALADQPLIDAADVRALMTAFCERGDKLMLVPRVTVLDGPQVPGNPVLLSAELCRRWINADDAGMGRRWRQQHPELIAWWDTNNSHYAIDLDTPDDVQRFEQQTGQVLRWAVDHPLNQGK